MSGGEGAAYGAMVANAIKAFGTIVHVEPSDFLQILEGQEQPLVVRAVGGIFATKYKYLTSYGGLAFYCKSSTELTLPADAELVNARRITMPDL